VEQLDTVNRKLLTIAQKDFPLTSKPYKEIGEELGISGEEVIDRLKKLKEAGYIRRIGGIFSSQNLGYKSTLAACKVDEDNYYQVVEAINKYEGVTHNYRRDHEFNLWFTLIAPTEEKLKKQLTEIENLTGVNVLRELPAKRFFKLGVNLDLEKED
jgi:DNA-binding Lrp family transcriptional regulator